MPLFKTSFPSRRDKQLQTLGKGVSGSALLYRSRKTKLLYVVKTYHERESHESTEDYYKRVLHEYNMLQQLDHPNIIKALTYTTRHNSLQVILEAGSVQNMAQILRSETVSSVAAIGYWKQVCDAVRYIHGRGICHRDLKMLNLVLGADMKLVKVIDWCTSSDQRECVGLVGSPEYAAPEQFNAIRYDGMRADVWSLGILLVYFLDRKYPWKRAHIEVREYEEFCEHQRPLTFGNVGKKTENEALEITKLLLLPDPKMRPSIEVLWEMNEFTRLGMEEHMNDHED